MCDRLVAINTFVCCAIGSCNMLVLSSTGMLFAFGNILLSRLEEGDLDTVHYFLAPCVNLLFPDFL